MAAVDWGLDSEPLHLRGVPDGRFAPTDADDPWQMPSVRAAHDQGFEPAPEAPLWVFLPATWPHTERAWLPDTRVRHMQLSSNAEPAGTLPWSTAIYFEMETEANRLLVQCGLPPRPTGASRGVVIAGPAPFGAADLDFFDGMDDEDREWYRGLTQPTGAADLDRECRETLDWVRDDLPQTGLPPGLLKMLQQSIADGMRAGAGGVLDDVVALTSDWGFDVREVTAPVRLLYAEDDTSVPLAHGEWLHAHLGTSELDAIAGGHLGGADEKGRCERELELLDWAVGRAGRPERLNRHPHRS